MLCGTCCSVCYYVLHTIGTVSITHVLLLMVTDLERLLHHLAMLYAYTQMGRGYTSWSMAKEM
jgi:hypothetical protein